MPLRIGEHAEARAGNLLRRLNDRATEFLGARKCGRDVVNGDEEQHFVLGRLARADRDVGAAFGASVDERVAGAAAELSRAHLSLRGTRDVARHAPEDDRVEGCDGPPVELTGKTVRLEHGAL